MLSTQTSQNAKPIAISKMGEVLFLDNTEGKEKNAVDMTNIQVLPPTSKDREVVYIAGPSGSGKSILSKNYIKQYQTMHPKNDVYIFSKVVDDPSLEGIKNPIYIDINDALVADPINILEVAEDCLVLFDDIDTISDRYQALELTQIMMDILECGRHRNITCVITSHLILGLDRKRAKTIMNEAHRIFMFPRATNAHNMNYFLKQYIGIGDKKTIAAITDVPSRWCCVYKHYPQHIIHSQGAFML